MTLRWRRWGGVIIINIVAAVVALMFRAVEKNTNSFEKDM